MCVFQSVSNVVWRHACAMAVKCFWGLIRHDGNTRTGSAAQKTREETEEDRQEGKHHHTDDKRLFWLRSVLVIPGRPASRVDGARACAQQRRLCFTQRGGALPARGPSKRQEPIQRVLPAAAVKQHRAGQVTARTRRSDAFSAPLDD